MKQSFILYDTQVFNFQEYGGISRYFCEIMKNINIHYDISVRYSKNYYLKKYSLGKHRIPVPNFIFDRYQSKLNRSNNRLSKKMLQSDSPYLFHPTYYDPYFLDYIGNHPFVITVHDMIHEKFPQFFPDAKSVIEQKKKVIEKANRIIAISENTKKDIIDILNIEPDKIDVIYHGTSMTESLDSSLQLPAKYILFVGDRDSYKNFDRLLKSFLELSRDDSRLSLICTGRPFSSVETEYFNDLNVKNKIIHISASDKILGELYRHAEVFVFPSIYEGFGIPILEAFVNHCPIALSNTSCFPEIAGKAGIYFDPYSIDSITSTLKEVLHNTEKRTKLIQAGNEQLKLYSWEKSARQTEETYRKACKFI